MNNFKFLFLQLIPLLMGIWSTRSWELPCKFPGGYQWDNNIKSSSVELSCSNFSSMYSAAVGAVNGVYDAAAEGAPYEDSLDSLPGATNSSTYLWMLKYVDVDIDYARWLGWLFTPVLAMFILPSIILILLYLSALFLYIYKWHRHRLLDAYERDFWEGGRKSLAALWDAQGWLWHGFEVVGLDNIPENGAALIVFYHGAIPIDFYYVLSKTILFKGRLIRCVGDRFLFKIPGWSLLMEAFKVLPGTVQGCANILKEGNLLGIAPGGVYEAQFGTSNYELLWKNRVGFAKVAMEAKVPIIPMFTQNIREAFRSFSWGMWFWRWLYAKTHLPLVPIYGFFPVKMKTYIGKPIPYDPNNTPEMLAQQAHHAIENMIKEHQRVPGSVFHALLERFYRKSDSNKSA